MAGTAARRAENEAGFRTLNERLEDRVLARNGSSDTEMLIVCECSREDCTERISLSVGEYELVRSRSRLFVVVSGHADPQVERVVMGHGSHEIVEKAGEAGLVADLTATRESSQRATPLATGERRAETLVEIGALARELGVTPSTLRSWERHYRLVIPRRDAQREAG